MLRLIMPLLFVTSAALFYQLLKLLTGKPKVICRMEKYTGADDVKEMPRKVNRRDIKAGIGFLAKGVANIRLLDGYKKALQFQLGRGRILLKAEEFIAISLIAAAASAAVAFLVSGSALPAVAALFAGWLIPKYMLNARIRKRLKKLNNQLSDALVLISNSLKAGYSFFQSVDIVAREMQGPVSEEFAAMQREMNLGVTTEEALENLARRVGSDDLELIITAVLIQRQTGGNLAEVLDNISGTIRDRIKVKSEVKTITAQGRMSGMIISLLPLVLGTVIYLINPEYMSVLFKTALGLAILGFSVLMQLTGIFFIRKIIKIEV